jgi:para-aminobenzoate synthetase component I
MTVSISQQPGCRVHVLEEVDLRLPFWRYAAPGPQPYACLLDSARDHGTLGQYSFISGDPFLVYQAKRQPGHALGSGAVIDVLVRDLRSGGPAGPPQRIRHVGDPFEELRQLLAAYRVDPSELGGHPVPFRAGAVGYLAYEAAYFIETLPDLGRDDLALPDMCLLFIDSLLAHCHRTRRSHVSVVGRGANEQQARLDAQRVRDAWLRRIARVEANAGPEWMGPPGSQTAPAIEIHAHFDEGSYARAVRQVKEHIFAGDAYEVCLTHRLESALHGRPWDLYQELRRINPAPFAAFMTMPEAQVVCSSPERFLHLGADRIAESRPIKGTRPRGQTPDEDERLARALFSSVKDRAENVMIVDLVRNDFGRVSKFGSVHVPDLMAVESYSTVFQMVSTVRGTLEDGVDGVDLIKACFPGGSMTGAPKIEAMKIIDRLEPVKRGIYSGAIGYIDFTGILDLNIVIRTIIVKDGRCYFNVGGAIVADSDPFDEYAETMDKARALVTALDNLRRVAGP